MNREEWIEKAREFVISRGDGTPDEMELYASLMADFAIEAVTLDGWVSVEERLPEIAQWCLVSVKGGFVYKGWYDRDGFKSPHDPGLYDNSEVLAWRYLPAPFVKEK